MALPAACFYGEQQFLKKCLQLPEHELVHRVASITACSAKPLPFLRSIASHARPSDRSMLEAAANQLCRYMALRGRHSDQLSALQFVISDNLLGLAEEEALQPTLQRLRRGPLAGLGWMKWWWRVDSSLSFTVLSSGGWEFQMMARLALFVRLLLLLPLVGEPLPVRGSIWAWAGIVVSAAVLLGEAEEAAANFTVWLQSLWNAADVLSALSLLACCVMKTAAPSGEKEWQLAIQWTLIVTILLLLLRASKRVATGSTLGPILRVVQRMLGTVIRLLGLSSLLVAALAIPLFILFREEMEMESVSGLLLVVPELLLSGFGGLGELMVDGQLQLSGRIIKLLGMVLIDLLLVNLLIAVMSEQYQPGSAASEAALSNLSELLEHHRARRHGVLPAPFNIVGYVCWLLGLRKPYRVSREEAGSMVAELCEGFADARAEGESGDVSVVLREDECEMHWAALLIIHVGIRPVQLMTRVLPLALAELYRTYSASIGIKDWKVRAALVLWNVASFLGSPFYPPCTVPIGIFHWISAAVLYSFSSCRRRRARVTYAPDSEPVRPPHLDGSRVVCMWLFLLQVMGAGQEAEEGQEKCGGKEEGVEERKDGDAVVKADENSRVGLSSTISGAGAASELAFLLQPHREVIATEIFALGERIEEMKTELFEFKVLMQTEILALGARVDGMNDSIDKLQRDSAAVKSLDGL
eukprot:PLAT5337.2.p1 GENE.PLAT5337.2~~PLAT5337.2.p1  ORF type:complete len:698 (+),score=34.06 PLAT5337.2:1105-3198(+)